LEIKVTDFPEHISAPAWNALAGDDPFLRHEFFSALHETGCASKRTGWSPQFITLWDGDSLQGAMPLYLKNHSYGEYVFDWAWANAYERAGYDYYPKLLSAIPFSPVTGKRLLAQTPEQRALLISAALALARNGNARAGISSLHCLFPPEYEARELQRAGMMLRCGIQFHWKNRPGGGYEDFEDFLQGMSYSKRKKIRQERRKVHDLGIQFEWLSGNDISDDRWRFFVDCYNNTYREHHSRPYLNLEFFLRLGKSMPENVLLILALRDNCPIGAALNIRNSHTLYGRYWGAREFVPGLHFETCYYQAIQYCILNGLSLFEGGAQGEHKLARGFLPVRTWSAHWLAHPEFTASIGSYLERETRDIDRYIKELEDSAPLRKDVRD
jgi:predicted N-acyltransferase